MPASARLRSRHGMRFSTNLSASAPILIKLAWLSLPLSTLGSRRLGLSAGSRRKPAVARDGVDGPAADDAPEKTPAAPVEPEEKPGASPALKGGAGPMRESTSESTSRRDGRAGELTAMGWDKGARRGTEQVSTSYRPSSAFIRRSRQPVGVAALVLSRISDGGRTAGVELADRSASSNARRCSRSRRRLSSCCLLRSISCRRASYETSEEAAVKTSASGRAPHYGLRPTCI